MAATSQRLSGDHANGVRDAAPGWPGSRRAWTPVVVMGAVGDVLTVACGAELRRYRNHDTGRLVDLVDTTGPDALLNERYGLLFLRT